MLKEKTAYVPRLTIMPHSIGKNFSSNSDMVSMAESSIKNKADNANSTSRLSTKGAFKTIILMLSP